MAYMVNIEELDEAGKRIRDFTEVNIKNNLDRLKSLRNETEWKGISKDAYFDTLDKSLKDMYNLSYTMERVGYYLQFVAKNYGEVMDNVHNEFEKYIQYMQDENTVKGDYKNV